MMRRSDIGKFLSSHELGMFLAVVRHAEHERQPRDNALFVLLASTGIRPSEALALTLADLHLTRSPKWIQVRRLKKKSATPVVDELEIPEAVAAALKAYTGTLPPAHSGPVFRLHRRSVQRLFRYYARKAGLARRFYCYCLRHTAATRIYLATRDIRVVQAILGHDSPDTSTVYAHVTSDMLRDHVNTYPPAL